MARMIMKNNNIGARKLLNLQGTDPGTVWVYFVRILLYEDFFIKHCALFKQNKVPDFPSKIESVWVAYCL